MAKKDKETYVRDVKAFIERLRTDKRYKVEDKKVQGAGGLKGGYTGEKTEISFKQYNGKVQQFNILYDVEIGEEKKVILNYANLDYDNAKENIAFIKRDMGNAKTFFGRHKLNKELKAHTEFLKNYEEYLNMENVLGTERHVSPEDTSFNAMTSFLREERDEAGSDTGVSV